MELVHNTWYTWHYVQQGHFPSPDLAHLQFKSVLAPILNLSEISKQSIKKCGMKRVHNTWFTQNNAKIFKVLQGHFPGPDMAHLQSKAVLGPILSISEISKRWVKKCGVKRVHTTWYT